MSKQTTHSDAGWPRGGREAVLRALNAAAASLQRSAHSEAEVFRAFKEQVAGLGLNGSISVLDETGERMVLHAVAFPGRMEMVANFEKLAGLKAEGYEFDVMKVDVYRQVVQTGETVFVPTSSAAIAQMLPEVARPFSGRILKTFGKSPGIFAPLISGGHVRGVLYVAGASLTSDDMPAMEAFANHISVALDNARLFAALQQSEARLQETLGELGIRVAERTAELSAANEALRREIVERAQAEEDVLRQNEELAALNQIGQAISRLAPPAEILDLIFTSIGRVLDNTNFYIALYDEAQQQLSFPMYTIDGQHRRPASRPFGNGLTEYVIRTRAPLLIPGDVEATLAKLGIAQIGRPCQSLLAVPMLTGDKVIGVITVQDYRNENVYTPAHVELISTFAAQAAIALENARLFITTRRQAEQLEALHQVSQDLIALQDLNTLLRQIVERAMQLLNGDAGGIYLYRPKREVLEWVVRIGENAAPIGTTLNRGEGLSGRVWETGEPLIVDDYGSWAGRSPKWPDLTAAVLGVPIQWGDDFLGVLNIVVDSSRGCFTSEDAALLSQFAAQAAIAICNARLYEAERKRATQLAVVNRVAQKAVSILDPKQLLQEVVADIQQGFEYYNVLLLLLDETAGELESQAIAGGFESLAPPDHRQAVGEGLIGWAAETGRSLLVNDVSQDPRYIVGFTEEAPTRSEMCVPLKLADQVIGVLDVQETQLNAFDEMDLTAMEILADQIAVAIENARLYEEAQHELAERVQSEEALRESEERFRAVAQSANDAIISADSGGNIVFWNKGAQAIFGYEESEVLGQPLTILMPELYRDAHQEGLARLGSRGEPHIIGKTVELHGLRKDESEFPLELSLATWKTGEGTFYSAIIRDITERVRAEEQMRRQDRLAAVGRLAGGIAHDFNNLLTAINGFAELMQFELSPDDPLQELAGKILDSGRRAADLVRQLLAFSRKQIIEPQVLNLNEVVANMDEMLRRIIGEDIQMETVLAPDLWPVKVDPTQIEQVVINLAVNARDAMPNGGRLTIETANVVLGEDYVAGHLGARPGEHALLVISDTGVGMSGEVQARIFEPFFTTKTLGKGTGLGLSTVYGIVKQSGGDIWVYSEEGRGTSFKIYLPRASEAEQPSSSPEIKGEAPSGSETVLLVEDNTEVRELVQRVLRRQGYTLLEAQDGQEALRLAASHSAPIHLLLTDVIMPGMSGKILAGQLAQTHPGLKTLFMSGYTDNAIAHHGVLGPDVEFLQKPFSPVDLARKVRAVLDG